MPRIKKAFEQQAKIAYLTAEPNNMDYFLALAQGGANVLEIGIPFSDPIADGPVIQRAMERSLALGTTLEDVLTLVAEIRPKTEAALILFTYLNPILQNQKEFLQKAKEAGADGILIVDLPYEESASFRALCKNIGLAFIAVAAPSTPLIRIECLAEEGGGFLYYACRKGTTGARNELPIDLEEKLLQLKKHSKLPIAVGFGIANQKAVKEVLRIAEGCVVGSYFVNAVEKGYTGSTSNVPKFQSGRPDFCSCEAAHVPEHERCSRDEKRGCPGRNLGAFEVEPVCTPQQLKILAKEIFTC